MVSEKVRLSIHKNIRKSKALFLRGNNFYCPCCQGSFSRFLKKGNGLEFRSNAVCPSCGSLERTRLLYLYLKNETDIFDNKSKILHFAPEDILKKHLLSNSNYLDVDLNPLLASCQMDITDIDCSDNSFDYIICSHVLGHIPDEKKALDELFRVLKESGSLFFLSLMNFEIEATYEDPLLQSPSEKLKAYGELDLQRLYGTDFGNRISRLGINVERIDYRTHFSEQERVRMSLGDGKREIIYKITRL